MSKFKIGDDVRFVKDCHNDFGKNRRGEVVKITSISDSGEFFRVNGETYGFSSDNFELVKPVEYEDQWHLNDGKVAIPDDAETVKSESGSIVAYRKVKRKPWKFGEIFYVNLNLWRVQSQPKQHLWDTYNGVKVVKAIYIRHSTSLSKRDSILFMVPGFLDTCIQVSVESPHIYRL